MREADRIAIDEYGIPSLQLMENAGQALADWLSRRFPENHFSILCGKGNNGGDGLVMARHLVEAGRRVDVFLVSRNNLSPDASANLDRLEDLSVNDKLKVREIEDDFKLGSDSVIVDALLGTGMSRNLDATLVPIVEEINSSSSQIVSIDIPSGLNGLTGIPMPLSVRANFTSTLAALKTGLVLNQGSEFSGELGIFDIGIDEEILERVLRDSYSAEWIDQEDALDFVPAKKAGRHKYSEGDLIALTGSAKYPGASILSTRAAMRVGCGFVNLFVPSSISDQMNSNVLEAVVHELRDEDQLIAIENVRKDKSCLLLGCGLDQEESTRDLVCQLLKAFDRGVLDADGIGGFEGRLEQLEEINLSTWIMTPHAGELARLVKGTLFENIDSPIEKVAKLAVKLETYVLLKGDPVIIASPDGTVKLFQGSAEFATAGTGDVLAGMIAGYLAQGLDPEKAALAALGTGMSQMWKFKSKYPDLSIIASDLLDSE